jgi:hypothetical protein
MDKYYYFCEFDYGRSGKFYQEIENGIPIRFVDLNGLELILEGAYGYYVIDPEPKLNLFNSTETNIETNP